MDELSVEERELVLLGLYELCVNYGPWDRTIVDRAKQLARRFGGDPDASFFLAEN